MGCLAAQLLLLVASLVVVEARAASFVQLLACSDANCTANCSILTSHELGRCELGSPTSARQGVKAEFDGATGELVFDYWDSDAACGGRANAQSGFLEPFACQSAAPGRLERVPPRRGRRLRARLRRLRRPLVPEDVQLGADDDAGDGLRVRGSRLRRLRRRAPRLRRLRLRGLLAGGAGAAGATALADACAKSACDAALEVPCMDCGEVAPSPAACEACVVSEATAPNLAGLCNFTLEAGGACDARACGS
ncbi:hypothetical protein JL720_14837 [Aureococcus anophagefferens]|nr:hypothetical protein JL720_14837 [Aureococcus anophagefferens]